MKILWILLFVLAAMAAVFLAGLFLMKPRREQRKMQALRGFRYAHRGLHNQERGVPENSVKAFRLAAANGFGAELDVRLTKDRMPVVFHDKDLSRMCGVEGSVETMELRELRKLQLQGTNQRIPTLEEVLALFEGKTPLIIELKTGRGSCRELCTQVCRRLEGHRGDYCIESFDPRVLRWLRRNEPFILRGQLVDSYRTNRREGAHPVHAFLISHCFGNFLGRPDFIAWCPEEENWAVALCRAMGAMMVQWTIMPEHDWQQRQGRYDALIFQWYTPDPEY